jgi:RNA polymerase subunit RPABC4/transcription elongation factor Spt4
VIEYDGIENKMVLKLVYYGPAMSGKTTNLLKLHNIFCPFCGSFKQRICRHCKMPLEKEWGVCPSCGTQRGHDKAAE